MARLIVPLWICLLCISTSAADPLSFPTRVEKNQARTTLSLALAALKSGRTQPLLSLFHPFEVFIQGQGWQPAEAARQVLRSLPESAIPPAEKYTFHSLREIADSPILKRLSENLFQALDHRGLIALAANESRAPVFYLSRENNQDPWAIFGLDTSDRSSIKQKPVIPDSWERHRSPVCSGSLPLPKGWTLHRADAGEPDRFISLRAGSPPAIHIDSREFNGPITEFSLNWIRMILFSGNVRNVRLRLVRKGFRADFSWSDGKGVLGILSRSDRLLFFSICVDNNAWNSLQSMIPLIFDSWHRDSGHSDPD